MSSDDRTPEEEFTLRVNAAMADAIQNDADLEQVAAVSINTARELYDHYGAGEDYGNFMEFVVDVGFQTAEIEDWLESIGE